MTKAEAGKRRTGGAIALLVDVGIPVAMYYLLRYFEVSQIPALIASGLPPAIRVLYTAARYRELEGMGIFILTVVALNFLTALLTGDARTLLIRGGWVGLLIASWMFGSLIFARKPVTYQAAVSLMPRKVDQMECFWETRSTFRLVWRRLAVIWGCGTLAGVALNILFAFTLPVDSVPAVDTAMHLALFVLLQIITQVALHREGTMRELWGEGQRNS